MFGFATLTMSHKHKKVIQRDKPFVYEEKEETKRLQLHELPPERFTEQENQFSIGHNKLNGASRQSDSPLSTFSRSFLRRILRISTQDV